MSHEQATHRAPSDPFRIRMIAIGASFVVGVSLMGAKFYIYSLTDSSAILSDALESIINVAASAFALISIILSAQPPDESHPYGHGKIEYFSAGFEGALIIIAAVGIFITGVSHILAPRPLPHLDKGLVMLLATAGVNLVLGVALVQIGKRTDSLTLTADGRHVLTDVYTSGGVVLGLFLVHLTGWFWLDGMIACLVGINIIVIGLRLIRIAFSGLMDESDPALLQEVAELIMENRRDTWIDIHRLRAIRSGTRVNIDFHMILPAYLTLEQAHAEVKKLETLLLAHYRKDAQVTIHMDPCADPDCPVCGVSRCETRAADENEAAAMNLGTMQRFSDHRLQARDGE